LASLNESQSKAVWIWDMQELCLICILLHEKPVRQLVWNPMAEKLAICTGSQRCAAFERNYFISILQNLDNFCLWCVRLSFWAASFCFSLDAQRCAG
jgi:hypothetical protein